MMNHISGLSYHVTIFEIVHLFYPKSENDLNVKRRQPCVSPIPACGPPCVLFTYIFWRSPGLAVDNGSIVKTESCDIFARNALYMQNNLLIRWIKQYAHKHFLLVAQHILIVVHDWNFEVFCHKRLEK